MALSNLINFGRPVTEGAYSPVYYAGRRDVSELYSMHEQNAKRWKLLALVSNGITVLAVVGLIYVALQSKYIPYVVERDHLGDEVRVGPAERASGPVDPRIVQAEINRWIHDVRVVTTDMSDQRFFVFEAYNRTDKNSPAHIELDDWFKNNDPRRRAEQEIVNTTIISTLPETPTSWTSWIAKWKEETRGRDGVLKSSIIHEMTITVIYRQPVSEDDFAKNVSGIFVTSFDWTK